MASQGKRLWGARVGPDVEATLFIAMAFRECSMQELLEPVISEYARGLAEQPEYAAAIRAKLASAGRERSRPAASPTDTLFGSSTSGQ